MGVAYSKFPEFLQYVSRSNYGLMLNHVTILPKNHTNLYSGSWLHHLISNPDITTKNLVYVLAVVIAVGGDLQGSKDTNGVTPYALIGQKRFFGYQIYKDIQTAVNLLLRDTQ